MFVIVGCPAARREMTVITDVSLLVKLGVLFSAACSLFNSVMSQMLLFFRFKGDGEHVTPISEAAE